MSGLLRELASNLAKIKVLLSDSTKDLPKLQQQVHDLGRIFGDLWDTHDLADVLSDGKLCGEFVNLVASASVVTTIARADLLLGHARTSTDASWLADGQQYARWLGRGAAKCLRLASDDAGGSKAYVSATASLVAKSLSFGYSEEFTQTLLSKALLEEPPLTSQWELFLTHIPKPVARRFLFSVCRVLSGNDLTSSLRIETSNMSTTEQDRNIAGSAAVLRPLFSLIEPEEVAQAFSTLVQITANSNTFLRAIVVALSDPQQDALLQKAWAQFGDRLVILHSPILQQEEIARVVVLCAAVVYRRDPMQVLFMARSGMHTSGTSARLKSSSPRVRFLGMSVGVAVSELVDKAGSRMDFEFEGQEAKEVDQLRNLLRVSDVVGSIQDLQVRPAEEKAPRLATRTPPKAAPQPSSKIMVIEEIEDSDEDDLVPMSKPSADPEDEDDDPTLINRDKHRAPIYIRELISGLQDSENAERFQISIETAATLVRRKANLGSEVRDHVQDLASLLIRLRDPFDSDDFDEHRTSAMAALLLAEPEQVGPLYAHSYFTGDYSISQRITILQAIASGAQGLAGSSNPDTPSPAMSLPERLHRLYLAADVQRLEQSSQQRTSRRSTGSESKTRRSLIAGALFFPLIGRSRVQGRTGLHSSATLLPAYLHTLSLLLVSAGPGTQGSSQMVTELWNLLLSLRVVAVGDESILEGSLFGFLTILNLYEDKRRLAEQHPKELVETHEWVEMVNESTLGASVEGDKIQTLAAAVLVASKEIISTFHRLLMGDMVDL